MFNQLPLTMCVYWKILHSVSRIQYLDAMKKKIVFLYITRHHSLAHRGTRLTVQAVNDESRTKGPHIRQGRTASLEAASAPITAVPRGRNVPASTAIPSARAQAKSRRRYRVRTGEAAMSVLILRLLNLDKAMFLFLSTSFIVASTESECHGGYMCREKKRAFPGSASFDIQSLNLTVGVNLIVVSGIAAALYPFKAGAIAGARVGAGVLPPKALVVVVVPCVTISRSHTASPDPGEALDIDNQESKLKRRVDIEK
ncbi:hypothetical protein MBM_01890 [Drepanopeziza brunnea f. sp. 'multigermtubi' MB_m1]|uniref:Uncharacterized protein n=1 Tax=Marssonina brunnea f. sp. multigermtubi (strain MB_m1) TaxID=1072389 RepID=K1XGL0_MARBU|nr:uncharacterized protein MBM_01890 [Drepanopeziza brunnea f. sp. 'multigermtubi' MB_m1]EKD19938.1 hypothetical protein MBM_01890 [Drepanopeziza brunnea f. sp. 'multigermtubi' MB_m1]